MSFTLRPASPGDVPALRAMLLATWHATYDATLGAEKVRKMAARWHSEENLAAEVRESQTEPAAHLLLLAVRAEHILGTASAHHPACGRLELARLYVMPQAQGSGVGSALLRAVVVHFPGATSMQLEVEPSNVGAIAFYTHHGFVHVAEGVAHTGETQVDVERLVMEARLPWTTPQGRLR